MKKGFNASAKFPAVKEKSAAFTGSCLGGKLPRPSRAHPAAGQGPSCARAFRLRPFCHFPVRSRLRDMGPAQPNKALSHLQKPGARAAKGPFSPRPGGRQAAAPKPRISRCGTGPSCARAFHLQPFLSFLGPQPPARCPPAQPNKALSHPQKPGARAAEGPFFSGSAGGKLPRPSRAYPTVGRGPSCARAFRLRLFCHFPVRSRLRDVPRRSRLHLLGVCGMINTAQALGPRKGRGGAPCRERRGRYGT